MFGIRCQVMLDNGPQLLTANNEFCRQWEIEHITSSPRHAQSNGFIERQIRYVKPIIKKCLKSNGDINLALLKLRATPLDSVLPSPAELMFGRPVATALPSCRKTVTPEPYQEHLQSRIHRQKEYAD